MDTGLIKVVSEDTALSTIASAESAKGFVWEFEGATEHLRYMPKSLVVSLEGKDLILVHTDYVWLLADMEDWEDHFPEYGPIYDFVAEKVCEAASRITSELNPYASWPDVRTPAFVREWDRKVRNGEEERLILEEVDVDEADQTEEVQHD